jgi:hypothetical protein
MFEIAIIETKFFLYHLIGAIFQSMLTRFCSLLLLSCMANATATAQSNQAQTPRAPGPVSESRTISFFPYHGRWHGGDVAYSIQLSPTRYLWLFGDTFVGSPDKQRVPGDSMPRNSIGIADCPNQTCHLTFAWNTQPSGASSAFFDTRTSEFYWPLDGFVDQGTLYVVLQKMHTEGDGGAFGFDYSGVVLASIKNYSESPALWKIQYQPILRGNTVIPGVAAVSPATAERSADPSLTAGYAYFFTWLKNGHSPEVALVRLPTTSLADAALSSGHWQYLRKGGEWALWTTPASLPKDARVMVHGNYTEFTVVYHSELRRWLMVLPGGFMDGTALFSFANTLTGKWSAPDTLYHYPESQPSNPDHAPNVFCYAAKEHPELETEKTVTFTYACNSLKIAEVLANPRLYHPVVVNQPMSRLIGPAK